MINAESLANSPQVNGILDTAAEVASFNSIYMIPVAGISCTYP